MGLAEFARDRSDKVEEIRRIHGGTLIATLRRVYGRYFAPGHAETDSLGHALTAMDHRSLTMLLSDHEAGRLAPRIRLSGKR